MTDAGCQWVRCLARANLAVRVGADARCAALVGVYCLLHAVLTRRAVAARTSEAVWFGVVPPLTRLRLVGDSAAGRPLHRHAPRPRRDAAG